MLINQNAQINCWITATSIIITLQPMYHNYFISFKYDGHHQSLICTHLTDNADCWQICSSANNWNILHSCHYYRFIMLFEYVFPVQHKHVNILTSELFMIIFKQGIFLRKKMKWFLERFIVMGIFMFHKHTILLFTIILAKFNCNYRQLLALFIVEIWEIRK